MSDYVLTEQAERDLNEIWDYIAGQTIEQADAVAAPSAQKDLRQTRRISLFLLLFFRAF